MKKLYELTQQFICFIYLHLIVHPIYLIYDSLESIKIKIQLKWIEVRNKWKKQ